MGRKAGRLSQGGPGSVQFGYGLGVEWFERSRFSPFFGDRGFPLFFFASLERHGPHGSCSGFSGSDEHRQAANGGAKRIVRFWGGKTYHRAPPPKPVLEASESGISLVCAGFL